MSKKKKKKSEKGKNDNLICLIRIAGKVGLNRDIQETLNRLRLKRKYSCVVIKPTKEQRGMIKKVSDFIAFGEISKDTFSKLIEKRGKPTNKKKVDSEKVVEEIEKGKSYEDLNLKPFFRLHPPRKGIDSKVHFGKGKGVLGNNGKKINDLVERML